MHDGFATTIPPEGAPPLTNWEEISHINQTVFADQNRWIFRGQRDARWALSTSLERALEDVGIPLSHAWETEGGLLRRFQRQAHHYISPLPADNQNFPEWLSWMQHFGAPTRLMDWTHSFYVGLYFAVKDLKQNQGNEAAVWAIDWRWIEDVLHKPYNHIFHKDTNLTNFESFNEILGPKATPGIAKVNAFRLNPRLVIQQGTFILPTNVNLSFAENLDHALSSTSSAFSEYVMKVRISDSARNDSLKHLLRMNVSEASLFPDLSGFAASLKQYLVFEDVLWPHEQWRKGST